MITSRRNSLGRLGSTRSASARLVIGPVDQPDQLAGVCARRAHPGLGGVVAVSRRSVGGSCA